MSEKYFTAIKEFNKTESAKALICNSLKELVPIKGNRVGFFLSLILALFFAFLIGLAENTVDLLSKATDVLIGMQLAIFGCIFAVYSILLAFLNNEYMKRLANVKTKDGVSQLKQSVTYYESVLFLFFINIGITCTITLLVKCLNPNFRLTQNIYFDTSSAVILIFIYFTFSFRVFYELKSTIYNTIVLFRASIAYKFIDFNIEDKDKENNDGRKQ